MAADYPNAVMPIVCSLDTTLCLYLKDRYDDISWISTAANHSILIIIASG